jgi:ATP-dependent helicase/nuclease subunit A
VPVAGVDRMLLAQPIAVQDLLSLVRFVLQPADDLALAEVLVSPLGGLGQDALYRLRLAGGPLWSALGMAGDPAAVAARAFLEGALRMADQVTPHDFLAAVLADGGRARFLARLGREAEDGLDTLLAEALLFETRQPPTMQGFLRWLDEGGTMVKRDADSAPGLVRIMTVHGAKGSQAPVVVLADALRGRKGADRLLMVPVEGGGARLPIVYGGKERLPASARRLAEAADAADRAEDRRLLYVALTRAEDVLVVAGQAPRRRPQEPSWHAIVRGALEGLGARSLPAAEGEEPALLLEGGVPVIPRDGRAEGLSAAPAVPAWARTLPPAEPLPPRPLTPSAPGPDEAPLPPPSAGAAMAAARGRLLHRLFERLPALPPAARAAAARRAAAAAGLAGEAIEEVWATARAVLEDPAFAALFGPDALAEAPIAGVVDGRSVAGTLDRLLVTDARVLVADFKTGLMVPASAEAVHWSQLRQMAAYRALLRAAFPGRDVTAALLFTAGPKLLYLPDKLLDRHWPPGEA